MFEALQNVREQAQAFGVACESGNYFFGAQAQPEEEEHFQRQHSCQRQDFQSSQQKYGGGRGGEREKSGDDSPWAGGKQRRRFGPVFERAGIEANFEVFAQQSQLFA